MLMIGIQMSNQEDLETQGILSEILYKYTSAESAQKILENRKLRFARPSEMNDPFDIYIDDLFGMDLEEVIKSNLPVLLDKLLNNPELYAKKIETDPAETRRVSDLIKNISDDAKKKLQDDFLNLRLNELHPDFAAIKEQCEKEKEVVINHFKNYGIFCATKSKDNLLMWVHYAQQHKGAVLGFKPDIDKDSFLNILEPVIYSDKRAAFFDSSNMWLEEKDEISNIDLAKRATKALLHTKSLQWSYEEEWRLTIPDQVPEDEPASFLSFYPNELAEVYLGYRMENQAIENVIKYAKKLNPKVLIYRMTLVKHEYALFPILVET